MNGFAMPWDPTPQVRPLYWEEIEVGRQDHSRSYEVTKEEVLAFAERWDPRAIHLDEAAAVAAGFDGITSSASLTFAIRFALYWDIEQRGAAFASVAGLGGNYRLPRPAYVGDHLTLTRTVLSKRVSNSRPGEGIVTMRCTVQNQRQEIVMDEFESTVLVERQPARA
jgi:acyl dehydratase